MERGGCKDRGEEGKKEGKIKERGKQGGEKEQSKERWGQFDPGGRQEGSN